MFGIFKKKLNTIEEHLEYLVKNPKLKFQLDVYRNNQVDFQVFRQSMLNVLGVNEIDNLEGLAILVSFNSEKDRNEKNKKRFLKSSLYEKSIKIDSEDSYVLKSDNKYKSISKLFNEIQTKVYNYTHDTDFGFTFIKHK